MNDLVILALPEEAPDLKGQMNVFFSGVGKVNAAAKAAQLIERYRPKRVINFGTAGGITVGPGFYEVTKFVQRDMLCCELGSLPGQTPFDNTPVVLDFNRPGLTCSTGDNFVTNRNLDIPADVVDMEAYALAKVCHMKNVEFLCWKFVSDQADENALNDWNSMVSAGQPYYIEKLSELHNHLD
jgi:adenosylhomocysteine nucleosidase